MTGSMRALALVPLALLLPSTVGEVGAVPPKGGPPRSHPACGAKILPLVEGNVWTYEAVSAREPILPELAKLAPRQPKKIVITVKSVKPKNPTETIATLEEKMEYEIVAENKEKKKPAVMQ